MSVVFLIAMAGAADAASITVGHGGGYNHQTIRDALAEAATGDTILVDTGVYHATSGEVFPLNLKSGVILKSATAAATPEIRGGSDSSVFVFENVSAATLAGFKITNGSAEYGGGIYISASNVVITNCTIEANYSSQGGGGIYVSGSTTTLLHCDVTANVADLWGGGIHGAGSDLEILQCSIVGNLNAEGIVTSHGTLTVDDSNIGRNQMGGVAVLGASCVITGCDIANNGGFGGIALEIGSSRIENCLIANNGGGGISCQIRSSDRIRNCTIYGNTSSDIGGGLYCDDAHPILTNCILWENSPSDFATGRRAAISVFSSVTRGIEGYHEGNVLGYRIIDDDPLFTDAINGEFRLLPGSPCIDSGTEVNLTIDLDGNSRPVDVIGTGTEGPGAFDMGCYEFQLKPADLDSNGHVNARDLLLFQNQWHEHVESNP